jgi:hypothetical protein
MIEIGRTYTAIESAFAPEIYAKLPSLTVVPCEVSDGIVTFQRTGSVQLLYTTVENFLYMYS